VGGAYFRTTDDGLQPVPEARSPWAEDMLHGRLLAGLAAREAERAVPDPELRVARLTLDMFRFPPMTPYTVTSRVARSGRRVGALDVTITCGGAEVARASVLLLRTGTAPEVTAWRPAAWQVPPPDDVAIPDGPAGADLSGWEIRLINEGGFWSTERKRVWSRDRWSLVEDEPLSPLVRAALAADLPNPLANAGGEGLRFINADLTLFLARPPTSDWIGLDVVDHVAADGVAIGSCRLYDLDGPIGSSTVCAVSNEPLEAG
jgi:hypothetical protein